MILTFYNSMASPTFRLPIVNDTNHDVYVWVGQSTVKWTKKYIHLDPNFKYVVFQHKHKKVGSIFF
jgi:hypothetical protein